jgi:hypothetical protein
MITLELAAFVVRRDVRAQSGALDDDGHEMLRRIEAPHGDAPRCGRDEGQRDADGRDGEQVDDVRHREDDGGLRRDLRLVVRVADEGGLVTRADFLALGAAAVDELGTPVLERLGVAVDGELGDVAALAVVVVAVVATAATTAEANGRNKKSRADLLLALLRPRGERDGRGSDAPQHRKKSVPFFFFFGFFCFGGSVNQSAKRSAVEQSENTVIMLWGGCWHEEIFMPEVTGTHKEIFVWAILTPEVTGSQREIFVWAVLTPEVYVTQKRIFVCVVGTCCFLHRAVDSQLIRRDVSWSLRT